MGIEDRDYYKQQRKDIEESHRGRWCPGCKGDGLHLTKSNSLTSYEGDIFSCSYCHRKYQMSNGHLIEIK
jgi:hypothetical protein